MSSLEGCQGLSNNSRQSKPMPASYVYMNCWNLSCLTPLMYQLGYVSLDTGKFPKGVY